MAVAACGRRCGSPGPRPARPARAAKRERRSGAGRAWWWGQPDREHRPSLRRAARLRHRRARAAGRALEHLQDELGELPPTRSQLTGRGSQLFYSIPADARIGNSTARLGNPVELDLAPARAATSSPRRHATPAGRAIAGAIPSSRSLAPARAGSIGCDGRVTAFAELDSRPLLRSPRPPMDALPCGPSSPTLGQGRAGRPQQRAEPIRLQARRLGLRRRARLVRAAVESTRRRSRARASTRGGRGDRLQRDERWLCPAAAERPMSALLKIALALFTGLGGTNLLT